MQGNDDFFGLKWFKKYQMFINGFLFDWNMVE